MAVATKKKHRVDVGQVWQEFEDGAKVTRRFLRVESISGADAVVSERRSEVGRFSAIRSRIKVSSFRRPRFALWREHAE